MRLDEGEGIWFTLPAADVIGSPDARLHQDFLAGENLFGADGPGSDTDRATLARSVTSPSTAVFVSVFVAAARAHDTLVISWNPSWATT